MQGNLTSMILNGNVKSCVCLVLLLLVSNLNYASESCSQEEFVSGSLNISHAFSPSIEFVLSLNKSKEILTIDYYEYETLGEGQRGEPIEVVTIVVAEQKGLIDFFTMVASSGHKEDQLEIDDGSLWEIKMKSLCGETLRFVDAPKFQTQIRGVEEVLALYEKLASYFRKIEAKKEVFPAKKVERVIEKFLSEEKEKGVVIKNN